MTYFSLKSVPPPHPKKNYKKKKKHIHIEVIHNKCLYGTILANPSMAVRRRNRRPRFFF